MVTLMRPACRTKIVRVGVIRTVERFAEKASIVVSVCPVHKYVFPSTLTVP